MGSCCLAVRVGRSLSGAVTLSPLVMHWTYISLFSLLALGECLVLLDPNTGRTIELPAPQGKPLIFRTTSAGNNLEGLPAARSDYISPSGVPLYKLRKRNPFGFGG